MNLLTINLDASALDKLGKAGIKSKIRLRKIVEDLSITAVRAFQSKVPVDTGELRNTKIEIALYTGLNRSSTTSARIYVDDTPHYGSKKHPISASELAMILQAGKDKNRSLRRTRNSQAFPGYSSIEARTTTAGWIDSGRAAFFNNYRKYLRDIT